MIIEDLVIIRNNPRLHLELNNSCHLTIAFW